MNRRYGLGATHALQLSLGFIVWAIWFVAVYGGLSVACAIAPPPLEMGVWNWINASLALLTLMTVLLLSYWAWRSWSSCASRGYQVEEEAQEPRRFIAYSGAILHLLAAVATLAVGLPILVLPPCI